MAGISSKALNFGDPDNKRGFNGGNELQNKEFFEGSGLEMYDAVHRMYDPQIGRFGQPDKLGDLSYNFSLYAFANDNPVLINDPLGLMGDTIRTNKDPNKTPGFGPDPNNAAILPGVTVSASNHRYQTFVWYGYTSEIDTHFKGNLELFSSRMKAGQDLLQRGDRYNLSRKQK